MVKADLQLREWCQTHRVVQTLVILYLQVRGSPLNDDNDRLSWIYIYGAGWSLTKVSIFMPIDVKANIEL